MSIQAFSKHEVSEMITSSRETWFNTCSAASTILRKGDDSGLGFYRPSGHMLARFFENQAFLAGVTAELMCALFIQGGADFIEDLLKISDSKRSVFYENLISKYGLKERNQNLFLEDQRDFLRCFIGVRSNEFSDDGELLLAYKAYFDTEQVRNTAALVTNELYQHHMRQTWLQEMGEPSHDWMPINGNGWFYDASGNRAVDFLNELSKRTKISLLSILTLYGIDSGFFLFGQCSFGDKIIVDEARAFLSSLSDRDLKSIPEAGLASLIRDGLLDEASLGGFLRSAKERISASTFSF